VTEPLFIEDKVYRRSEIHDQFGGNRRGGIAASAIFPYIFIFSGQTGKQHGYVDKWENAQVFSYTGEGQLGDMKFSRGNLELRNHKKNGKRVFLFFQDIKGFAKFESELEYEDVDFFTGVDKSGSERIAIKFFLKRIGTTLPYEVEHTSLLVATDSQSWYGRNIPNVTERQGLITSRVGQGAYRKSVLFRWNYCCAVTGYSKKEILIASHIFPWKDASNQQRLDVHNSILLSPTYDALFDKKLISFENNGKIILSKTLSGTRYQDLGITGKEIIKAFSQNNFEYLERHRERLS
jgi:5-methylcytosine-specific restriction enzyme A